MTQFYNTTKVGAFRSQMPELQDMVQVVLRCFRRSINMTGRAIVSRTWNDHYLYCLDKSDVKWRLWRSVQDNLASGDDDKKCCGQSDVRWGLRRALWSKKREVTAKFSFCWMVATDFWRGGPAAVERRIFSDNTVPIRHLRPVSRTKVLSRAERFT